MACRACGSNSRVTMYGGPLQLWLRDGGSPTLPKGMPIYVCRDCGFAEFTIPPGLAFDYIKRLSN